MIIPVSKLLLLSTGFFWLLQDYTEVSSEGALISGKSTVLTPISYLPCLSARQFSLWEIKIVLQGLDKLAMGLCTAKGKQPSVSTITELSFSVL